MKESRVLVFSQRRLLLRSHVLYLRRGSIHLFIFCAESNEAKKSTRDP